MKTSRQKKSSNKNSHQLAGILPSNLTGKLKWLMSGLIVLTFLLSACQPDAGSPTEVNSISAQKTPETSLTEQAQAELNAVQQTTVAALTQEALAEINAEATNAAISEKLDVLIADINSEIQKAVNEAGVVARYRFEALQSGGVPAEVFAQALTSPENLSDKIYDSDSFTIGISPDGLIYMKLEVDSIWGKAGEVAIFDVGDDNGMFVTLAEAGVEDGEFSFVEEGYYTVAKDKSGNVVAVIDASKQWVNDLTKDEKLVSVDVMEQMVESFANGSIEFPDNLSNEQYFAFIEKMNEEYANKPIYVEAVDKSGNPVVMYHSVETNEMETLSGTYEENKEVIDQNGFTTYVEIHEDETGNLQFVNPDTGELTIVPNSADVDWTKIIDINNLYDGYLELPTTEIKPGLDNKTSLEAFLINRNNKDSMQDMVLVQAVLISNETVTLTRSQGLYFDYECLNMILIKTDKEGKPTYGVRIFVGPAGMTTLLKEGDSTETDMIYQTGIQEKVLRKGVYFVLLTPNEANVWATNLRANMNMENVVDPSKAYNYSNR